MTGSKVERVLIEDYDISIETLTNHVGSYDFVHYPTHGDRR